MSDTVKQNIVKPLFFIDSSNEHRSIWKNIVRRLDISDDYATHKKIHDDISEQLRNRDQKVIDRWDVFPSEKKMFTLQISSILKDNLDWPNHFFIPEDPFELIFRDKYGDLSVEESAILIEKLIGRKIKDSIWHSFEDKNYSEVIDFLYKNKKA